MIQLMNTKLNEERFLCVGENFTFKDVFDRIAKEFNVEAPRYLASKFMTSIAWRLAKIESIITGRSPRITSDSAKSSRKNISYSNQKIKDQIEFEFTPISEAISNTVKFYESTPELK